MQSALAAAAETPLEGAHAALQALHLTADGFELNNANLVSDLGCAVEFGNAALAACAYNVRINHKFMKDAALISTQRATLEGVEREGTALATALRAKVGLSP